MIFFPKKTLLNSAIKKFFLAAFLTISFINTSSAATFYWVGGTGNWTDYSHHWATTSGGSVFQTHVPTSVDDVLFDANSFTAIGQIVTISAGIAYCHDMTWANVNYNPYFRSDVNDNNPCYNINLNIYGSLSCSIVEWQFGGVVSFESTSAGNTISVAGYEYFCKLNFNGVGGEWTLLTNVRGSTISLNKGTLKSNNQNISCSYFFANAGYSSLLLGSSQIQSQWEIWMDPPLVTIDADSAVFSSGDIRLPANQLFNQVFVYSDGDLLASKCTFNYVSALGNCFLTNGSASGNIFRKLVVNGNLTVENSHTFNYIELKGGATFNSHETFDTLVLNNPYSAIVFPADSIQTITGELTTIPSSCADGYITIKSNKPGTKTNISKSSGSVNCSNLILEDIDAGGGASFNAVNSINYSNVSGWTITGPSLATLYWIGGTGNWSDPSHWSLSSGGVSGTCIPSMVTDVVFDANSFNSSNQKVTIDHPTIACNNMDWSGVLFNPSFYCNQPTYFLDVYGSLTLSHNMSWNHVGGIAFRGANQGNTINTAGLYVSVVKFEGIGSWTLQDSIFTFSVDVNQGFLNTNGKLVRTTHTFNSNSSSARAIKFATSTIISYQFEAHEGVNNNLTIYADSATFYTTNFVSYLNNFHCGKVIFDFYYGSPSYCSASGSSVIIDTLIGIQHTSFGIDHTVVGYAQFRKQGWMGGSTFSITELECLNDMEIQVSSIPVGTLYLNNPGYTFVLLGTVTLNQLITSASCTSGFININTGSSGVTGYIIKSSGSVNCSYLVMKDITATGGATFTAVNSVNGGNVSGWTFTASTPRTLYWVGGTGNWSDVSHWSLASGGSNGQCPPTSVDNVIFDNNSFPSAGTLSIDVATPSCKDMSWVQTNSTPVVTNTYTPATSQPCNLFVYGSLNLNQQLTWSYNVNIRMSGSHRGNTINTKGRILGDLYFQGTGADWTLQDSVSCADLVLNSGKLNTNNKLVRCSQNILAAGDTLLLGSSNVYCTEWHNYIDSTSSSHYKFNAGTSNIFAKVAFSGQNQKYNMLDMRGTVQNNITAQSCNFNKALFSVVDFQNCSGLNFKDASFQGFADLRGNTIFKKATFNDNANLYDNNQFDTLVLNNPGKTIACAAGKTQTINHDFVINSDLNDFIGMISMTQGSQTTISSAIDTLCFDYITLRDVNFTGGTVCMAGLYSANYGNNTGCTFTSCQSLISDVWPGNSNGDNGVDNDDLLNIGIGYGHVDVSRVGASLTWTAQPCQDWNAIFADFLNVKNADCDGNGMIDSLDLHALLLNYGNTLPSARVAASSHNSQSNSGRLGASGTDLFLAPVQPSYSAGTWISVPINLATVAAPLQNAYGVSFKMFYDSTYVESGSMSISYGGSWLVTSTNKINLEKSFPSLSEMDVAFSRIDHTNASGNGQVAMLTFKTKSNVNGVLNISFSDCNGKKNDGSIIGINPVNAALNIGNSSTVAMNSLSINNICSGSSSTLPFVTAGSFNSGNIFTAQLSDGTGNFSSPVNIGSISATSSGTINTTIPSSISSDTHYRIRIVSSNPSLISPISNDFSVSNVLTSPGAISGPVNVCSYKGSSLNAGYSVSASAGASSYAWTVPTGATIVSGQGTTNINVSFAGTFASGNISVISSNSCGNSPSSSLALNVIPAVPASISGPLNVCSYTGTGTSVFYSISAVTGATSYVWTVPANATLVSGQGTTGINVTFASVYATGSVSVKSVSACGTSALKTITVTKTVPVSPVAITGPTNICHYLGSTILYADYTIASVANANSYNWTVPSGATIMSGQGTTNIKVYFSYSFTSGNISVQSVGNCGNSIAKTLAIMMSPDVPGTISGSTNACGFMGYPTTTTYSISPVSGVTSYTWTVPAGATIVSGQGTTSINVSYSSSFVSGNVTVKSISACGTSSAKTLAISKTIPAAPAAIAGSANACFYMGNTVNVTYSVTPVTGAAAYTWAVPTGASIVTGQGTNSIDVSYSSSFVSGNVSVQSISNCGNSVAKTLAITKTAPAVPGTITGPVNACPYMGYSTNAVYSIAAVSGASSYNWTVPSNATIVSGQGTATANVSYSTAFVSGYVSVQSVAACGSSIFKTLAITKTIPVAPTVLTGPTNPCSYIAAGTNAVYTTPAISGAASYFWTVPANATIVSGQNTMTLTVSYSSAFVSGSISVKAVSGCGSSLAKTLTITKTVPTVPGTITGPTNACSFVASSSNATYSIAAVTGAVSYNWTVPANATLVAGQGTTSIDVNYSSGFVSGSVTVQSVIDCGSSTAQALAITKTVPAVPGTITGPVNACPYMGYSTNATYSIAAVAGATSYNWTVPTGASIVSGQGTTTLTVSYLSSFVSGNVSVVSVSNCGNSAAKTLAITKTIPVVPVAITGPTNACIYMGSSTNAVYSIAAVSGAASYNWTVPTNATIVSGQGTTSITVSYSSAFVSGNVSVQSISGCGNSIFKTLAITKTIPVVPVAITGATNACPYVGSSTNAVYSIAAVSGASSYNWVVPANSTIISGQGTTSITLSYSGSFVSGNISVQSLAGCGNSIFKTLAITKTLPVVPVAVTGPTNACPYMGSSTNAAYSIAAVSGATSYNWTVPANATIVSGQGTTTINVSYSGSFVSGNVSVASVSNCGSSAVKTLAITKTLPVAPTAIAGSADACPYIGSTINATYSITAVAGVTSYIWTVPANTTIVSGQGTTSIDVSYLSGFVSGNISVQSVTNCGSSTATTLAISKTLPAVPTAITGPANACAFTGTSSNATYSITAVAGATSYNWTVPANASIISGQGTTSIDVSYLSGFVSGNVSVQSVIACGSSAAKTLAVTNTIPAVPGTITGAANVCAYTGTSTNVTYSIAAVTGAASYNWTVPANASIVSGQGTTSIDVNYLSSFVSGNISVASVANCGNSAAKTLAITKTVPAVPVAITGPTNVCFYMGSTTNVMYRIAAVAGATSYHWTAPAGATIVSGQGNDTIYVSYPGTFVSGTLSVLSASNCGNSVAKTMAISKTVPAVPAAITGPVDVCSYLSFSTNATYSIAAVTNAVSYNWTVPANAAIVSGQGSTSIDVSYSGSFVSGNVSVQTVGGCGSSAAKTLAVNNIPQTPGAIAGPVSVCGITSANYSVALVSDATSYNWTLSKGISPAGGTTGTISTDGSTGITTVTGCIENINVNIDSSVVSTAPSVSISVVAANACAVSSVQGLSPTICASSGRIRATGSDNPFADLSLNLYPNPVGNFFYIDFKSEKDRDVILEIYDVIGNLVTRKKQKLISGSTTAITEVTEIKSGLYTVRIIDLSDGRTEVRKFVKE